MNIENLTDEQLASMSAPPVTGASGGEATTTTEEEVVDAATEVVDETATPDPGEETPVPAATDPAEEGGAPLNQDAGADAPVGSEAGAQPGKKESAATAATTEAKEPDYKALYEELMSPLRANGKDIELKSPQELKQLASMGANYTKNMQNIRHHKKALLMLENNGLLDEGQISFLIDLSKGDPAAIQKLLKDKQIDPLDVDTRGESTYTDQGNHRLTDNEVAFREQVDEIVSTPRGAETISVLNSWDQASKDMLWKNPQLMSVIHNHRLNGTYDVVAEEVARRRIIGLIPVSESFLSAYNAVGEEMLAARQQQASAPTPVATRAVSTTTSQAGTSGKVAAAAPTRSGTRSATPFVNPLALSDEDFEKAFASQFKDRL